MLEAMGPGPFEFLVDLGTGTGRILELFADRIRRGIGIDINRDMLAYARTKLEYAGLTHCHVRQGDLFSLGLDDGVADAVVLHQVLHYLDDPGPALAEAARILAPGGRALIVDFAPHALEFLREQHAHRRLGIEPAQIERWANAAGLEVAHHREMTPEARDEPDKLTVSLWLADKKQLAGRRGARAEAPLEVAS